MLRILGCLVVGGMMLLAAACQQGMTATPPPTPTAESTPIPPTPTVETTPSYGVISRQQLYEALQYLDIGLMPLVRHTDEMFNTRRSSGDIAIDIFGPANHVEAVEADFRLTARDDGAMVMGALLLLMLPESEWDAGWDWLDQDLPSLSASQRKVQQQVGDMYLTLYFMPSRAAIIFSVDTEQH